MSEVLIEVMSIRAQEPCCRTVFLCDIIPKTFCDVAEGDAQRILTETALRLVPHFPLASYSGQEIKEFVDMLGDR